MHNLFSASQRLSGERPSAKPHHEVGQASVTKSCFRSLSQSKLLHAFRGSLSKLANDSAGPSPAAASVLAHETGGVLGQGRIKGLGLGSCAVPFSGFSEAGASVERRAAIDRPLPRGFQRVHLRLLAVLECLGRLPASAGSPELHWSGHALARERSVGFAGPVPRVAF